MKDGEKLSRLVRNLVKAGNSPASEVPAQVIQMPRIAVPREGRTRSKLWDLEEKHLCPVVGTCIPLADLLRFARRFNFEADTRNEFAMHVEAVCHAKTRNPVSAAIQRHLDRKYEISLATFARLKTDDAVLAKWKACLTQGEVAGPLWAAYTHKNASAATRHKLYEDIHMLSHQIGAGQAADARRLGMFEAECAGLKRSLDDERAQHRRQTDALQERIGVLGSVLADRDRLADEAAALRTRLAERESGSLLADMEQRLSRLQRANEQMASALQRVWDLDRTLRATREEAAGFARERDLMNQEREALEQLLLPVDESAEQSGRPCRTCRHDSAERCVLYVGGRTSLVTQYRELAGRLGIRLVHHDGGLEESLSRLPEMIHGADAVVCPTDCVSHTAYYHLKNHCKRTGKPCLFFKGAGVSSFALAMTRVSNGEFSLAGQDEA